MRQSRLMSIVESLTNVIVGIVVAYLTQVIVFPWFDIHADTRTHISITLIFTAVSILRSYILRRTFNRFVR